MKKKPREIDAEKNSISVPLYTYALHHRAGCLPVFINNETLITLYDDLFCNFERHDVKRAIFHFLFKRFIDCVK